MIFRLLIGLLFASGLICFALYIATGKPIWRWRAVIIVKWTLIAALGFFAMLFLERLVLIL